ncbi:MAG: peptidoglycan DD-metalloendopeptidase family protein [Bacteroidales bacterium]|nr:peptidoglycan DD-metalloendopeptidase family protein [Candidatus Physcousia equi]
MNTIRTVLACLALTATSLCAQAQDLLADHVPADRHIRALDSISLFRITPIQEFNLTNPGMELYPEWNNQYAKSYDVKKPNEYTIDLRQFHAPCDSRLVTSHYGYRRQFGRNHYGTDIKLYTGDTVRAAFNGKIRVVAYEGRGYGNYVIIRHDNGLETVYGHMSKHLVRENQTVKAGEPIGLGGNTGRSTGSHLHFETRFLGEFIDPEQLIDFAAQDVRADYYVYRKNAKGTLAGNARAKAPVAANDEAPKRSEQSAPVKRPSKTYLVKKGDTLTAIAKKHGMTVQELCRLNLIKENANLRVGQAIRCS